jgi:hypothetical protein
MTDGPQQCALPGCNEMVEQPEDGGPRRLYCSPAHRAAARKMRHAARMDSAAPQQAASDVTQPIAQAPGHEQSEQPTTELPAPLGVSPQEQPEPAPVPDREWSPAAAWTVSPPTLPAASTERTVRTITSQRVKKQKPARTAADRRNAASHMRRRAIASVAIASLVAGGASYFVTENIIPTTPTPLPPQAANPASMDADVWADKAQVVLASLSNQLDAVAQAEADWLALPAQRRAQEPAAVQALKDRKALLEQQRAILMSQLDAFKALPERTSELTSAQAQLDAVERTLNESTTTAASPDYKEALRQLESQREIRRQQRDHAAQALTDLRNGVEQALSSPLPAEKDETSPIVERVKAVVAGRPDPGEKDKDQKHDAADEQQPAANPRREDGDEERGDVGTTAPPDPERPNAPDILADGGRDSGSDGGSKGEDKSDGPVQTIAGTLGSALGQGDSTNKDERANRNESRGDDGKTDGKTDNEAGSKADRDEDRGGSRGGLGGVVRDVGGTLLGGSDRDDDRDDDRKDRRERSSDRDDDNDGKNDRSSRWSDRDDDDDRGSRRDRDDDDDDRGGLVRGITDGLLGGDDRDDDDGDRKKPSGKAERKRDKDREDREEREHRHDKDDSDKDDSDDERADKDHDRKKPSGKAERERKRDKDREDREEREHRHDKDDDDKKDRDDDGDRKGSDKKDKDSDKDDDGDSDKGKDHGDSDDDGDDDGGKSDKKDKGGDDDGGDSGDSDSGGDDD